MTEQTDFGLNELEKLPAFTASSCKPGQYVVKSGHGDSLESPDNQFNHKIWFKSSPLSAEVIQHITKVQLFASSHDQGFADEPEGGNWTWFELAILENESSDSPRIKESIELVWRSHRNNFLTDTSKWKEGTEFSERSDLLSLLDPGNVIAVRLCARFPSWAIYADEGLLVFDIGPNVITRQPPEYTHTVNQVQTVQSAIQDVNAVMGAAFQPSLPSGSLFFRADTFGTGDQPPLRVLSLDGGGVRGMASLKLLQAVMQKTAPGKKPCEVFDIIGGTSTGGLIAIMLGRLRMTIDEAIKSYITFMKAIFPEKGGLHQFYDTVVHGEIYDAEKLAQTIKDIVKERLGGNDELLLEKPTEKVPKPCKVFCMAVRQDAANNRGPVYLRSYINDKDKSLIPNIKVWEAGRATSAAPVYFKPLKVGDYTLVDGGLGANNPIGWMWSEILSLYGPARSTACFLSIGTGIPPNASVSATAKGAVNMISSATNSQIAHLLFRTLIDAFAPKSMATKYYRLNVGVEQPPEHKSGKNMQDLKDKDLQDYQSIGGMDDVAALNSPDGFLEMTKRFIKLQDALITDCATTLAASIR